MNVTSVLATEANKLRDALREISGLRPLPKLKSWNSYTRGRGVAVAQWTGGGLPRIELYLDRAAGERYRFWTGFASETEKEFERLLYALPKRDVPKRTLTEEDMRELPDGNWIYKNPSRELGQPYIERMDGWGCFLGFYDWGDRVTEQSTLDVFKAAQYIESIVSKVRSSVAKPPPKGPGRGTVDPERKAAVELEAIRAVTARFEHDGYDVVSRERNNCGWDLDAKPKRGGPTLKLEVKGLSGQSAVVELSPNEFGRMQVDKSYRMCIVTSALSAKQRVVRVFEPRSGKWIGDGGMRLGIERLYGARLTVKS